MQKKYSRLNPDKERVRWESEEGKGFRIYLETHMMVLVPASCHLTTLLNLTLKLTLTLTTNTSKWFLAIAVAMTMTMKSKSKLNKHLWEQISLKIREIDHPLCAPTSGGTYLKSSRRLSTKKEGERRKRKRKKEDKRKNGRQRKMWGRRRK